MDRSGNEVGLTTLIPIHIPILIEYCKTIPMPIPVGYSGNAGFILVHIKQNELNSFYIHIQHQVVDMSYKHQTSNKISYSPNTTFKFKQKIDTG